MAKSILEELTNYRLKVEKDGKSVVDIPGIAALPLAMLSPKASLVGMVAAPFLGCNVHLESEDGNRVDVEETVKKVAENVVDTANKAARTIKDEIDKAWDALSADDPEECSEGKENDAEDAAENKRDAADLSNKDILEDLKAHEEREVPTIKVNPENPAE